MILLRKRLNLTRLRPIRQPGEFPNELITQQTRWNVHFHFKWDKLSLTLKKKVRYIWVKMWSHWTKTAIFSKDFFFFLGSFTFYATINIQILKFFQKLNGHKKKFPKLISVSRQWAASLFVLITSLSINK